MSRSPKAGPAAAAPYIPYGRQSIDAADIAAVVEALGSDRLAHGPLAGAFERALATAVGAPEAVACSSGTAARAI